VKVKRKPMVNTNSSFFGPSAPVMTMKKNKKKKRRLRPVSKRVRKYVKRASKALDKWSDPIRIKLQRLEQLASTQNNVAWFQILSHSTTAFNGPLGPASVMTGNRVVEYNTLMDTSYKVLDADATNTTGAVRTLDMSRAYDPTVVYLGKRMAVQHTATYWFKNNTNFPAKLTVYIVQATQHTSMNPYSELGNLRHSAYASATPSVALEHDFTQYWSVPRSAKRIWRMVRKYQINLDGGQESHLSLKLPYFVFNPDRLKEQAVGVNDYPKGASFALLRIQGVPAHGSTGETNNLCMGETLVDCHMTWNRVVRMSEREQVQTLSMAARENFFAVTAAKIADPEQVVAAVVSK
jgi:hypothetical protein